MARVSIQDCLTHIENRFALVAIAADRTRQIMDGDDALLKTKNKEGVTALREIADGLVITKRPANVPVVDKEHKTPGAATTT